MQVRKYGLRVSRNAWVSIYYNCLLLFIKATSGSINEIHFSSLNCRPFAAQFCLVKKKKETLWDQGDWNPGPERLVPRKLRQPISACRNAQKDQGN